jgi:hypothetical protein
MLFYDRLGRTRPEQVLVEKGHLLIDLRDCTINIHTNSISNEMIM